jgi:hypothetical protein
VRRSETLARAVVIAVALAATVTAPPLLSAPLALLSLVNGGQLLAYLVPGDDPVERCLMAAGGVAVLLILLGLVLNYVPGGLTPSSYGVGWAVVSWALLVAVSPRRGLGGVGLRRVSIPMVVSLGLLAAATVVAFLIGSAGIRKQDQEPVLALSSPVYGGTEAHILVSSVNAGGVYELLVLPDGQRRGEYSQLVKLGVKGTHSAELSVHLPAARCYWKVALSPLGWQATAERELILWTGTSSTGIQRPRTPVLPLAAGGLDRRNANGSCSSASTRAL